MPDHVPGSAVRVSPSTGEPETVGGVVLTGRAASTSSLGGRRADVVTRGLVPVTSTRTLPPTSAGVSV